MLALPLGRVLYILAAEKCL